MHAESTRVQVTVPGDSIVRGGFIFERSIGSAAISPWRARIASRPLRTGASSAHALGSMAAAAIRKLASSRGPGREKYDEPSTATILPFLTALRSRHSGRSQEERAPRRSDQGQSRTGETMITSG